MNVGIVGHESAKFTPETEAAARNVIRELLAPPDAVLVSGHCHLGGIDIWAEEEYAALPDRASRPEPLIYPPKNRSWAAGYKPRNILIAEDSVEVHCLVVAEYPASYAGMRFDFCYHCGTNEHIKSGGCWTGKYAKRLGKKWTTHIVRATTAPKEEP